MVLKTATLPVEVVPPGPFLRWAGGKGALLAELMSRLPLGIERRRYFEPFLGGAALFFALCPHDGVLSDVNPGLMATYRCVRRSADALAERLLELQRTHSAEQYYVVRHGYNASRSELHSLKRASEFIYLNKTNFNGLHRVNSRGEFNVPIGRQTNPRVVDRQRLLAAQQALQRVRLRTGGFEVVLDSARSGDFVYLDPPYLPQKLGAFTAYAGAFGSVQHRQLAADFRELDRRGCALMASNSDCAEARALYPGFRVDVVHARRPINRNAAGRGAVPELIIRNY